MQHVFEASIRKVELPADIGGLFSTRGSIRSGSMGNRRPEPKTATHAEYKLDFLFVHAKSFSQGEFTEKNGRNMAIREFV